MADGTWTPPVPGLPVLSRERKRLIHSTGVTSESGVPGRAELGSTAGRTLPLGPCRWPLTGWG